MKGLRQRLIKGMTRDKLNTPLNILTKIITLMLVYQKKIWNSILRECETIILHNTCKFHPNNNHFN